MKKLLLAVMMSFVLMGCAGNPLAVHSDPAKLVTPQQKLDAAIDQVNGVIMVAARQLKTADYNELIAREDTIKFFDILTKAADAADTASSLLNIGDLTESENQVKLAQSFVDQVTAYLITIKKKGQ